MVIEIVTIMPRPSSSSSSTLRFDDGATQFRLRLACSLLSRRTLVLTNVRADEVERAPGLLPHEASFLRLLDGITNGTRVEISSTGTQVRFVPGVLVGGRSARPHACPSSRNVGWFVEGLLPLAPFCKEPLDVEFEGVTETTTGGRRRRGDVSCDRLAATCLPLYARVGVVDEDGGPSSSGPSLRTTTRGAAPSGGGRVRFRCPVARGELTPLDLVEVGLYRRVRGRVTACRAAPSAANRAAAAAKGSLHRLLPDVWIHADVRSPKRRDGASGCGPDPSLVVSLTAETTEGVVAAAERAAPTRPTADDDNDDDDVPVVLPEDLGVAAAAALLANVRKGGCVDPPAIPFATLLMCLGPEDPARLRVGTLDDAAVAALRLYKEVFGVTFRIRTDVSPTTNAKTVLLSCLGTGHRNTVRAST